MIRNETIWITGASSGIGKAIAGRLAPENHLILSGRNETELRKMAEGHPKASVLAFDVSAPGQEEELRARLGELTSRLDRLILVAGDCLYFDVLAPDWKIFPRMMEVNYLGAIRCLAAAFDLLKAAPRPHLVTVGSMADAAPFPRAAAYGASKAALDYFSRSIAMDFDKAGIDVTLIKPGFVATPLTDKNDFSMPFIISAERAAERMVGAIERRKPVYKFPKRLRAALFFYRLALRLGKKPPLPPTPKK